jgi:hypothetical protein
VAEGACDRCDGDETWLADTQGHQIEAVSAQTGDLIMWDYRLPHGNSQNNSAPPRIPFYVSMYPTSDNRLRRAAIESWKTGHCVRWWRNRPGYDRVEPWPPAALTNLGCRLIGLDGWWEPHHAYWIALLSRAAPGQQGEYALGASRRKS